MDARRGSIKCRCVHITKSARLRVHPPLLLALLCFCSPFFNQEIVYALPTVACVLCMARALGRVALVQTAFWGTSQRIQVSAGLPTLSSTALWSSRGRQGLLLVRERWLQGGGGKCFFSLVLELRIILPRCGSDFGQSVGLPTL